MVRFCNYPYKSKYGETTVGIKEVKNYLNEFGYFIEEPEWDDTFDEKLAAALQKFKDYHKISYQGGLVDMEIDKLTLSFIKKPRCGISDFLVMVQLPKWPKNNLNYCFVNYTSDLPQDDVRFVLIDSLLQWSRYTNLIFTEVIEESNSDLKISFHIGDHNDRNNFDGPGNKLGHGFFPPDGRIHFDEDEIWTYNEIESIDLYTVALHEYGHSLGLTHSDNKSAVMYPYYEGIRRLLDPEDVFRIQQLYNFASPLKN